MTTKTEKIVEELTKDWESIRDFSLVYSAYCKGEAEYQDMITAFNLYRANKSKFMGGL